MNAVNMKCIKCGNVYELKQYYNCFVCGGILQIQYNYEHSKNYKFKKIKGIMKFIDFLPITEKFFLTLGEGDTPLVKADYLAKWLGLKNLYIKNEGCNPTGSFKDRSIAVAISKAVEFGANTMIISSSGNGGASAASYAAKAGLNCVVVVPVGTPINKVNQAIMYGGYVVMVEGPYSNSFHVARKAAKNYGWVNLTTTFANPYVVEGNKTITFEIIETMDTAVPDWVVIPVGDGPVLVGVWWGFLQLKKTGLISKVPKIAGIQAERCSPIVRAFEKGDKKVQPWTMKADTIATGIADTLEGYNDDGSLALECIRQSKGHALSVTEDEIWNSVVTLARAEGIFAEPTGAVSILGIKKMIAKGLITSKDAVVALITGNGLKTPELPSNYNIEPPVIRDAVELGELTFEKRADLFESRVI
jgi:threonine synthase